MSSPGSGVDDGQASVSYRVHVRHEDSFEHVVHATQVDREDGWTVFWSGNDVFMRLRHEHVVSLEGLV
jgi:hypothetical protein